MENKDYTATTGGDSIKYDTQFKDDRSENEKIAGTIRKGLEELGREIGKIGTDIGSGIAWAGFWIMIGLLNLIK